MDAEQLKVASEHTTYTMIIVGAIATGVVWFLTRIRALRDWQINIMKQSVRSVFDMEILPKVMLKEECATTHKVTDITILNLRDDVKGIHSKLDIMLDAILKKK